MWAFISSGVGFRFCGGLHFSMFAMYMFSLFSPTFSSSLSRFFPAAPQNGIPCSSSFFPGASPIKSISALGFPPPITMFVQSLNRGVLFTRAAS